MELSQDLLSLFLPEILATHFKLISHRKESEALHLFFEELNIKPEAYSIEQLHSKGFHKEITIQDFPLRGHQVYLHIKRRRWIVLETNMVVERDWKLVAKGTRLTEGFSSFFKRD